MKKIIWGFRIRDLIDDQSEESVLIERWALKEHELQGLFEAEDELGASHTELLWDERAALTTET